jgi:DNA (cytosine-5)-methyltransferase 1
MFTFVDLFAGIGGFRLGAEAVGGKCVAYAEISAPAIEVYRTNFGDESNLGDITAIESLPECDILLGGVPCQPWSSAGKNRGLDDPRGALWRDVVRLVRIAKPKAFVFENVKGLADPRHREALTAITEGLREAGYKVHTAVLDAQDHGLPQHRERLFMVGIRHDFTTLFRWPLPSKRSYQIGDYLGYEFTGSPIAPMFFTMSDVRGGHGHIHSWELIETTVAEKAVCEAMLRHRRKSKYGDKDGNPFTLTDLQQMSKMTSLDVLDSLIAKGILEQTDEGKFDLKNRQVNQGINRIGRVYMPWATSLPTLTASRSMDYLATAGWESVATAMTPTVARQCFIRDVWHKGNYRLPTDKEMAILQGFPPEFKLHPNPKKNGFLLGNSVPVPVVREVVAGVRDALGF